MKIRSPEGANGEQRDDVAGTARDLAVGPPQGTAARCWASRRQSSLQSPVGIAWCSCRLGGLNRQGACRWCWLRRKPALHRRRATRRAGLPFPPVASRLLPRTLEYRHGWSSGGENRRRRRRTHRRVGHQDGTDRWMISGAASRRADHGGPRLRSSRPTCPGAVPGTLAPRSVPFHHRRGERDRKALAMLEHFRNGVRLARTP